MLNIIDKAEFENLIKSSDFVVVDFWATWCGSCRMLGSIIDEYAAANPDVVIVKVNVDDARELADSYDVQSLPTVAVFQNGVLVSRNTGFMSKSAFSNFVSSARG
ncbi:MAG: thioredoxin [Alphaproteobacteria bacterium]|nr:thioredoxin [Alphaproteobacteria bacterium]